MRNALLTAVAASSLVAAGAWMRIDVPLKLQPESKLWVDGTSSTKSWSCKASVLEADVLAADANAAAAVVKGEKAVRKASVTIPAAKLDCGNGTMNDHMRKALKAEQFKTIAFTMTGYDMPKGTINGTLTLGGQSKPISIAATAKDAGAGQLRVAGSYDLAMSDYGLKAPTLMFGAMKVGDKVKVNFDVLLKAAAANPVP